VRSRAYSDNYHSNIQARSIYDNTAIHHHPLHRLLLDCSGVTLGHHLAPELPLRVARAFARRERAIGYRNTIPQHER